MAYKNNQGTKCYLKTFRGNSIIAQIRMYTLLLLLFFFFFFQRKINNNKNT